MSNIIISGGGGGGSAWGDITGTLSDQTDLQTALDGKVNDTGNETIAGIKTFSSAPIFSALTASNMPYLNASKALTASGVAVDNTTLALTITPTGAATNGVQIVGESLSGHTNVFNVTNTFGASGNTRAATVTITHGSGSGGGNGFRVDCSGGGTSSGQIRGFYSSILGAVSGWTLGWGNSPTGNVGYSSYVTSGGNTGGSATGAHFEGAGGSAVVGCMGYAHGGIGANARVHGVRGLATTETGSGTVRAIGVFGKIGTTNDSAFEGSDPTGSAGGVFSNGDTTLNILSCRDADTAVLEVKDGGNTVMKALAVTPTTVDLTADNQSLTVTNASHVRLTSDSAVAGDRTFVLGDGGDDGQILILEWNEANGTGAGELADSGNANLSAAWTPDIGDTLTLSWNSAASEWRELARSNN